MSVFLDSLTDSLKLIPFLFVTYLFMEYLEHHAGTGMQYRIRHAQRKGPLFGGLFGLIPQCGFSAAAASLYAGRVISVGTLTAVFLSTSDEMLPVFLSQKVPAGTILLVLAAKAGIGIVTGYAADLFFHRFLHKKDAKMDIHKVCAKEHCHCSDGIVLSAFKHTLKVFAAIFVISLLLNAAIALLGEDRLSKIFTNLPVIGQMLSALVGMIPNCASSVVIAQLYLKGLLNPGAMMSGLLANAGVGFLVLFRLNRNLRQNLAIAGFIWLISVFWGSLICLFF